MHQIQAILNPIENITDLELVLTVILSRSYIYPRGWPYIDTDSEASLLVISCCVPHVVQGPYIRLMF